jgi:UDP-GlcNAc3NAcA epimerase
MLGLARLEATVIFPVHPRTFKRLQILGLLSELPPRVRVVPPVGYLDMLVLEAEAQAILTDSGGVQREAFFLSVPSVILRGETEWPELLEAGASRLVGDHFQNLSAASESRPADAWPRGLFGDGDASRRIVACLEGGSR